MRCQHLFSNYCFWQITSTPTVHKDQTCCENVKGQWELLSVSMPETFHQKGPCHSSGCDKLEKAMTSYLILKWCTFKTNGPFEANSVDTDTSKPCVSLLGVVKKGAPWLALWDTAHMGFWSWAGGSGTNEVLSQLPGKNITYGALQNRRFLAADRPKTQRRKLTARQEKGLQYLYMGTVYHLL